MVYTSTDYPMGFGVMDGSMTFNPKRMEIQRFVGRAGSSPISVTGFVQNYLAYFMLPDQKLTGKMSLNSQKFNVNEWLVEEGEEEAAAVTASAQGAPSDAEVPMEVFEVPKGIDFTFNCKINTVLYDNLTLKKMTGEVILRDQEVRFHALKFNTLGGSFRMSGGYSTQDITAPDIDMTMTLVNVDIPQAYQAFAIVKAAAPVAKFMTGKVNSSLNLKGKLLGDMSPDLASITSVGDMVINNGSLSGFKPIQAVADKIKLPKLSKLKLDRTKVLYEIKDGRIWVDPFDVPVSKGNMRVAGSNGIDQTMDYNLELDIPTGAAGKAAINAVSGLFKRKVGDGNTNLKALIGLGGTVDKPIIKYVRSAGSGGVTDLKDDLTQKVDSVKTVVKDTVRAIVDNTIDKAKEEARKKADALLKVAEAQATKIRSEAKKAADKIRSESEVQAKKIEASAKNPLEKVAKRKAAALVRKKGKDSAAKLESEANSKANKVMADARKKADALLK
ncbi:MAG TPA: hypothetical protein ENJ82_10345 [Bacteroidetes bacterium]|nr:hypothetical protein [Bacteroidota bacterium]